MMANLLSYIYYKDILACKSYLIRIQNFILDVPVVIWDEKLVQPPHSYSLTTKMEAAVHSEDHLSRITSCCRAEQSREREREREREIFLVVVVIFLLVTHWNVKSSGAPFARRRILCLILFKFTLSLYE